MDTTPSRLSSARYAAGLACLLLSIAASLVLAGGHFNVLEAPGCGGDSACNQAAASAWGKLPLIGWPLSLFGLAWFASLAAGWTAAFLGGGLSALYRGIVRLGALGSLVYVGAMLVGGYLCPYCLVVHTGALAFLVVMERAPRTAGRSAPLVGWAALAFALVTGLELGADAWARQRVEDQRLASTRLMLEAGDRDLDATTEPFTGRYRLGPERAPIRLVVFSDYQCPFCRMIETQARELVETRDDVSLSTKHYPLCSDCNPYTTSRLHPEACTAASLAEAAGLLGGPDVFWRTHQWLFEQEGTYTTEELQQHLVDTGLDPERFQETLSGDEPLALVQADIEEAHELGVFGTPVVYINGIELRGIGAPGALRLAVEELSAKGLAAADASEDKPQLASERFVEGWRESPLRDLSGGLRTWATGPADAPVEVVLWGDYLTDLTAEADALVRSIATRRGDVRYVFRHFPINTACNPISRVTIEPESCDAHKAAQVAGVLAGEDGYWRMHEWVLANQAGFDRAALAEAAADLGLDPAALLAGLEDPATALAISRDCILASNAKVFSVPSVFINGRLAQAWSQEGLLETLIEVASTEGPPVYPQAPVATPVQQQPPRQGMDADALRAELDRKLQRSGAASARARLALEAVSDPEKLVELERLLDEQGASQVERDALFRTMERLRSQAGQEAGPGD